MRDLKCIELCTDWGLKHVYCDDLAFLRRIEEAVRLHSRKADYVMQLKAAILALEQEFKDDKIGHGQLR